jgi:hypothetical protein
MWYKPSSSANGGSCDNIVIDSGADMDLRLISPDANRQSQLLDLRRQSPQEMPPHEPLSGDGDSVGAMGSPYSAAAAQGEWHLLESKSLD